MLISVTNGASLFSGGPPHATNNRSNNPGPSAPEAQNFIKIGESFVPRSSVVSVKRAITKDNTIVYVAVANSDKG